MAYRTSKTADPVLQERHTDLQQMMEQTITIPEACRLYGVSETALRKRMSGARRWNPTPRMARYWKADVEQAAMQVRVRSEYHRMRAMGHPELPLFED